MPSGCVDSRRSSGDALVAVVVVEPDAPVVALPQHIGIGAERGGAAGVVQFEIAAFAGQLRGLRPTRGRARPRGSALPTLGIVLAPRKQPERVPGRLLGSRVVRRPDCQPLMRGSSRTKNQSIMSMRGFFRAIAYACFM